MPPDKSLLYLGVRALLRACDGRIPFAEEHSQGTARLAFGIATRLGCDRTSSETIRLAARLHDVGAVSISDLILLKPERLTKAELKIIRAHPLVGAYLLDTFDLPCEVKLGVKFHHERLDGSGYPEGLQGEEIPRVARIIAVADSYQAMTSARPFRPARDEKEATEEFARLTPDRYDQAVVDALLDLLSEEREQQALTQSPSNPRRRQGQP